jgi:hypothetical protein
MSWVGKFFRFWYDFIVGDDWRVAAGVGIALAGGGVLVVLGIGSDAAITLLSLGAIVVGLLIGLNAERRRVLAKGSS